MNIKSLKPYLDYVIDNDLGKNKKFEFISIKGKIYNLLFYKLYELDPPFEMLCIIDVKKNFKYYYEIHNNEIMWRGDKTINKACKTYCNRIVKMFIFL